MTYIQKTLMSGEQVLYLTHPHWIVFVSSVLWLLLIIFLPMVNTGTAAGVVVFGATLCEWTVRFAWIIFLYTLLSNIILYTASEYVITDRRIIMKTGFIRRNIFEVFLQKIESVQVVQSVLGRILNYGSITIGGVGGSKDMFYLIPHPLQFRHHVQERLGLTQK